MNTENSALEPLLNEHQVAKLLNLSLATIRRRRLLRQPPGWVKIGASVRYKKSAVDEVIATGEQKTTGVA